MASKPAPRYAPGTVIYASNRATYKIIKIADGMYTYLYWDKIVPEHGCQKGTLPFIRFEDPRDIKVSKLAIAYHPGIAVPPRWEED